MQHERSGAIVGRLYRQVRSLTAANQEKHGFPPLSRCGTGRERIFASTWFHSGAGLAHSSGRAARPLHFGAARIIPAKAVIRWGNAPTSCPGTPAFAGVTECHGLSG